MGVPYMWHTTSNAPGRACTAPCAPSAMEHDTRSIGNSVQQLTYDVSPTLRGLPTTRHAPSCATCSVKRENLRHATRDAQAQQSRTHRRRVRDRAALERDGSIEHLNHTAHLSTAGAASAAAWVHTPSADTGTQRASARLAKPPRTHRCFGIGYRHGVEQRGAPDHREHAAVGTLRTRASHRNLATAKPALSRIGQRKRAAHHTTHQTTGALRERCASPTQHANAFRRNMQRLPMQRLCSANPLMLCAISTKNQCLTQWSQCACNIQRRPSTAACLHSTMRAIYPRATPRNMHHMYRNLATACVRRVAYAAWHTHYAARTVVRNMQR
jgi:hypothetical protein